MFVVSAFILSLTFVNVAMANGPIDGNKIEIKSVKNTQYENLIQIDIKAIEDISLITLIDPDGKPFYSERIKGNQYIKRFSLVVDDNDLSSTVTIEITSKSTGKVTSYKFVPSEILSK